MTTDDKQAELPARIEILADVVARINAEGQTVEGIPAEVKLMPTPDFDERLTRAYRRLEDYLIQGETDQTEPEEATR